MSDTAKVINLHTERQLTFTAFADVDKHPRKRWLVQNFLGVGEMSDRDPETGETTTAPVVIPSEIVPQQAGRKKKSLSPKYERARRALAGLASGTLATTPPDEWGLPAAINIVPADAWRATLLRDGILDNEDTNVRKRFWDLKDRLVAKNVIGERDGYVWIAELP
jgi:hypothetical protein